MKKLQRILAILGVVLLLALYASTMIFALSGSENSIGWFKASIAATIYRPGIIVCLHDDLPLSEKPKQIK